MGEKNISPESWMVTGWTPIPIAGSTRIVEDYPIDLDLSTGILGTGYFQAPTTHITISSISLYLYHVFFKKNKNMAENLDHIFTNLNQWTKTPTGFLFHQPFGQTSVDWIDSIHARLGSWTYSCGADCSSWTIGASLGCRNKSQESDRFMTGEALQIIEVTDLWIPM